MLNLIRSTRSLSSEAACDGDAGMTVNGFYSRL